ncbi:hypothetical protein BHE90_015952 [Fusarium euwallaceae]|uniref:aldehyde dehydrogenase (NAD(+)) n=1 Tax=Fusarium euwallaceae TaxID=1147111 RepID=A0A430L1W3_9HYPO|nr:hypothetical protein BHE90_015952 [Fusarium euwallaceae]
MDFKFPIRTELFIHGKWVSSIGSERLKIKSAVDDSTITADLHAASTADVDEAVASAENALHAWQTLTLEARRDALIKLGDLMITNQDRLGYLDTLVSGKEISLSKAEAAQAGNIFKFYANYIDKAQGEIAPTNGASVQLVQHEPYGITAGITAFNGPLLTFAMKAAPALAAGNVMLIKASEQNPFSIFGAGELVNEAGIPPGALNIFTGGAEAGEALASHMKIRKITFTGSVPVGKKVQIAAARSNLKSCTLELGGKTPVIVFEDSDIAKAAACATSFMFMNGQGCVLGTRIYVQASILGEFLESFRPLVQARCSDLGSNPLETTTKSSPMYNHRQYQTVLDYIDVGKQEATLLMGGARHGTKGCYVEPTVFLRPKENARILKEEIFGPVVVIDTFETDQEVLAKANDTEFGLGAAIFTKDIGRVLRISPKLEAGTVTVNSTSYLHLTRPFGGWKQSGLGRELGLHGLLDFTQVKTVVLSE